MSVGAQDGTGDSARFNGPRGLATDRAGNVYVADFSNQTIRRITPAGVVTTWAGSPNRTGSTDGTAGAAKFNYPNGVAVDASGNVYVGDAANDTIRKISPAQVVTTVAGKAGIAGSADGIGSAARFYSPTCVAVDAAGNVYVSDAGNQTIRKITPAGMVTTMAGLAGVAGSADGVGSSARFRGPEGIGVDLAGNIFVADLQNQTIRKISPQGVVTTLAGQAGSAGDVDATGSAARFNTPWGLAVDKDGLLYVADDSNKSIRLVKPTGEVTTLAGNTVPGPQTDGTGIGARFLDPLGVAIDGSGNVYVADSFGSIILKGFPPQTAPPPLTHLTYTFTTMAGTAVNRGATDGTAGGASFAAPAGAAVDVAGNVFVADWGNHEIRKLTPSGVVTTLAGNPKLHIPSFGQDGNGSAAWFVAPVALALDSAGNLYVADSAGQTIRKVTPAGSVTTLAGNATNIVGGYPTGGSSDGFGLNAQFTSPSGVAVNAGGMIYVADTGNHTIRQITPEGLVTTLAGTAGSRGSADGIGPTARFYDPGGLGIDGAGNIYVADQGNSTIRRVSPDGAVITVAGVAGTFGHQDGPVKTALFETPVAVALDSIGNIFVAETGYDAIRLITPAGQVTTIAGDGSAIDIFGRPIGGSADGAGANARFDGPRGLAVDRSGFVYVADSNNSTIRKGFPTLMIATSGVGFGMISGQFSFGLIGPNGAAVVVEASSDLLSWAPVGTTSIKVGVNFTEPDSIPSSTRFYRLKIP